MPYAICIPALSLRIRKALLPRATLLQKLARIGRTQFWRQHGSRGWRTAGDVSALATRRTQSNVTLRPSKLLRARCQAFACRVSIASSRKPRRCCTAQRNGRTRALAQANAFLKRNRIIPPNISEKIESGNRVRLDPRSRVRRFASPPPLASPLPCEASVAVVRETPSR